MRAGCVRFVSGMVFYCSQGFSLRLKRLFLLMISSPTIWGGMRTIVSE